MPPPTATPPDDLPADKNDRELVADDEEQDDLDDEKSELEELDPEDIARRGEREGIDEDAEDDIS